MESKLLSLFLVICLIGLTSALYAGETITYENNFGSENLVWTIVGNSSNITILPNITINKTHIKIEIPSNMPPNSFTLVFLEEQTKEVVKKVHVSSRGGGGTRTKYVENKTYIEVPNYITIYENITDDSPIRDNENEAQDNAEKSSKEKWLLFISFLILVVGLALLLKKNQRNKYKEIEFQY